MPDEAHKPFGEYAPEPQTAGPTPAAVPTPPDEVDSAKYGLGKPHRIIVRGNVAADASTQNRRS